MTPMFAVEKPEERAGPRRALVGGTRNGGEVEGCEGARRDSNETRTEAEGEEETGTGNPEINELRGWRWVVARGFLFQ